MKLTKRQIVLLTTAVTVFYDEVAKTTTPTMKQELNELGKLLNDEYVNAEEET